MANADTSGPTIHVRSGPTYTVKPDKPCEAIHVKPDKPDRVVRPRKNNVVQQYLTCTLTPGRSRWNLTGTSLL